ncbi:MAG: recombination protein RecR [Chlamydiales bacterium]|nr:recombination protein RecR [Chlamydiales bacterium]
MKYPDHLLKLISLFKKFPGIGARSAERFAFDLLDWPADKIMEMARTLAETKEKIQTCCECGALIEKKCSFHEGRNTEVICIVRSPKDIFAIEETREYRGLYHVLGALLSPIQNQIPCLNKLKERLENESAKEVIVALDSTLEGDATALYLKKELAHLPITVSRLALGLPMGSSLDFVDGGTLGRALTGRINLH